LDEVLERVGLSQAANRPTRTYSAGMKRRVGLARVLLKKPELILLDEPFGQLDPDGVALMESVIGDFKAKGATLLVSTHDIERGLALADARFARDRGQPKGALEPLVRGAS
jgi:heme exporter protein A